MSDITIYTDSKKTTIDLSKFVSIVKTKKIDLMIDVSEKSLLLVFCQELEEKEKHHLQKGFELAITLCDRPSEEILKSTHTEDLKDCWHELRTINFYVGLHFLRHYLKVEKIHFEAPADNHLTKELVYYYGKRDYELWNIIRIIYPTFKKEFSKVVKNPFELYSLIVKNETEEFFIDLMINECLSFGGKKEDELIKMRWVEFTKQIKENVYPPNLNIEELSIVALLTLLVSMTKKLTDNRQLRFHAENYNTATKYLMETACEMGIARTNQGMLIPPYIWEFGHIRDLPRKKKKAQL